MTAENKDVFGDSTPFSEPYWYQGAPSPYYDETHKKLREKARAFMEKHIIPFGDEWQEKKDYPSDVCRKAYEAGLYGAMWPKHLGGTPPEGTEKADPFHELILVDELGRGPTPPPFAITGMALPPILYYMNNNPTLRDRVAREVITAQKFIALAISEPWAGSDVSDIRTTAKKEGNYYIVNGEKKYITVGLKADYFTTAVRTGGPGHGGISLLLIERTCPGINARPIKTQGGWESPPAYITFEDVKVPVDHLIGEEGSGFKAIVHNFNHERFVVAAQASRNARSALEEAIKYAKTRKTFGKRLLDHQVIRHKIAEMAREVETTHAFLEQVAFQMKTVGNHPGLGGPIALLKVQASRTFELCAREASQILGGASYLREGKGSRVEKLYRGVRGFAIPGGSEEIMLDLAMRQAKL